VLKLTIGHDEGGEVSMEKKNVHQVRSSKKKPHASSGGAGEEQRHYRGKGPYYAPIEKFYRKKCSRKRCLKGSDTS